MLEHMTGSAFQLQEIARVIGGAISGSSLITDQVV
jgi:hypothetical protein